MRTLALVALDLALVVLVARALRGVLGRLRQPPVMAEVLAGVVLGASVLGALPGDPSAALFTPDARAVLGVLGSVAVVAYLFGAGARLDLRALRDEGQAVLAVALASFSVPWAAGIALAAALHDRVSGDPPLVAFSLFLGTALAVTAVPVLARIVDARGLGDGPAGRIALGAAAGQELLVWPALAVALALGGAGGGGSPAGVLGLGALALLGVLVLARLAVPAVCERAPALAGPATLAALGLAAGATELAGLHLVVGAFLLGVALPPAPREAGLALLRARPAVVLGAVGLPVFFALPAMRVDVGAIGVGGLGLLGLVLAVAVAAKLGSAAAAARLAGMAPADALTVGALMNARGLVELVVLAVGLQAGLIDLRLFGVLVLMALATTLATGPLVSAIGRTRAPRGPAWPSRAARRLRPRPTRA